MDTEQEESAIDDGETLATVAAGEEELGAGAPLDVEAPLDEDIVVGTAVFSPLDTPSSNPDDAPIPVNKSRLTILPAVEEASTMTEDVRPPVSSATPAAPSAISQRRGCVLLLLGAILGSLLGMMFSLAILLGLNGTLTFSQTDAQLRRDITEANIRQAGLQDALSTRDAQVEALATRLEGLDAQQTDTAVQLTDVSAEMAAVEGRVTAVYDDITSLDSRLDLTESQIETAAAAAESFNSFLGGLRELLLETDPSASTLTATPTPTSAAAITPATREGTGTAVASPSATSQPTRTPQPSRTPLPALATNTPAPQP
ncbi:MAG: hypothetical protein IPM39_25105 [Chloroflexi bacterium]|nr:hypothetical protein [Chloroflexota bacterium]